MLSKNRQKLATSPTQIFVAKRRFPESGDKFANMATLLFSEFHRCQEQKQSK